MNTAHKALIFHLKPAKHLVLLPLMYLQLASANQGTVLYILTLLPVHVIRVMAVLGGSNILLTQTEMN